jgi:hypothetical protein
MATQPTPIPSPVADLHEPIVKSWIAPTEAERAQQLLDTHAHLLAAGHELGWLPNDRLLAHATRHRAGVGSKDQLRGQRPIHTMDMEKVIEHLSQPLTELRVVMKKKFKAAYEAHYPEFGLEKIGKNWRLPIDHEDLIDSLEKFLLPALRAHGFDQDPDTGTAVWQPLLDQLKASHTDAMSTDESRSALVGETNPQDEQTTKALRAIYHLAQAHFPDTWEETLRSWGWRKTSF